jgi:hypothetical protein
MVLGNNVVSEGGDDIPSMFDRFIEDNTLALNEDDKYKVCNLLCHFFLTNTFLI